VIVHRVEGRWQFAVAADGRNSIVVANLIDADLSDADAQLRVLHELAITDGVMLVGQWRRTGTRPNAWRADLKPIPQAR
jgi:hypothetical protein